MKREFTKEEMLKLKGCYSETELNNCSFMKQENITLESILNSEIPLKDKLWFIRNSIGLSDNELRLFAIGCATVVLPIYENKYPNNDAPRKIIEAAKLYLEGNITKEELLVFRKSASAYASAASDSACAAYAAYASASAYASAASDSACAAYASAYAATYACAASDYACAASAATANAVNYKDLLLTFFKEFTK